MRTIAIASLSILSALALCVPAQAAHSRHHATQNAGHALQKAQTPALQQALIEAEVRLARSGFSPGTIDGRDGENFANALHAFQQANGLQIGKLDEQTLSLLSQGSNEPALAKYTIQPEDVKGPFAQQIPRDFEKMAALDRLAYQTPRELLAEKFHMSEALLTALNPNVNFDQAGTAITVANVNRMPEDPKMAARTGEGSGSSAERGATAGKVVVDKPHHAVLVYSPDNRLTPTTLLTGSRSRKPTARSL
jgi:putative peptidoglycan binding protein